MANSRVNQELEYNGQQQQQIGYRKNSKKSNKRQEVLSLDDGLVMQLRQNGKNGKQSHHSKNLSQPLPSPFESEIQQREVSQQQQQQVSHSQSQRQQFQSPVYFQQSSNRQQQRQLKHYNSMLQQRIKLLNNYLLAKEKEQIKLEQRRNPFWIEDDIGINNESQRINLGQKPS